MLHRHDLFAAKIAQTAEIAISKADNIDRISALFYDWESIAAPVLRAPCEQFDAILRHGWRGFSVE